MTKPVSYKPINPKGIYEVWVSALLGKPGEYRVNLMEEHSMQTTESTDVNLQRPYDRRWLESYVKDLSKKARISEVLFGNGGCKDDVHYPLDKYKELYGSWKGMQFLSQLNITL